MGSTEIAMEKSLNIQNEENILSFYKGSTILVTGATGFLGKVLVEKLIRTCENINTVYILMRSKNGVSVEQRFKDLLKNMVFEKIRNNNPELLEKIKPIRGDIAEANIGMSRNDQELLIEKVDIIIHSAATIRFVEPLSVALNLNTLGTKRLLELSCKFKKLKSFVYVSTAYCNPDIFDIKEKIYPYPHDPELLLQWLSTLPRDTLNAMSISLQGKHPNTYTFTKNLAESVILQYNDKIPLCIVRPSIVMGSLSEPFPGWIDNLFGVTGILMEMYRGTVRSALAGKECIIDMVPVDLVANTCIAAAWHQKFLKKEEMKVYNCTAGNVQKITWSDVVNFTGEMGRTHPSKYVTWYPNVKLTTNRLLNTFWEVFTHLIPAFLLDIILRMRGKKPIMMKMSRRVKMAMLAGEYFALRQWKFETDNFNSLQKAVVKTEENVYFPCDMSQYNWKDFLKTYILGIRKYILRDSLESLTSARKKVQRLYIFQRIIQLLAGYFILYYLFRKKYFLY